MRFPYKPSPHIKANVSTTHVLHTVLLALLFVAAWSIVIQYINFGADYAIRAVFIILTACATAFVTDIAFYLIKTDGVKYTTLGERLKATLPKAFKEAPLVTALILALSLPVGIPLYAVIVATIFAEFIGKLIFGGVGSNLFNPAAVGIVIAGLAFGSTIVPPDAYAGATPMATIASHYNWRITEAVGVQFICNHCSLGHIFFGAVRGGIGEAARPAILIALVFLIYKKVIDWVVPVVFVGTVFVATLIFGSYLCLGLWYPVLHVFSGSLIFGAVFMATDPVTTPVNRQGRILFAIFLAMITLIIRFNATHTEAMGFSILIMNMFVPFIDRKTGNITTSKPWAKAAVLCIAWVCAIGLALGISIMLG
ncbi:MAG: RnfABCDGE type electron transport complex subunit D [Defluviitaleaceae bacterium]|nr:RnfABCDGE type electron transport complex subunit D [Defluviitaleaceae bacterium]